MSVEKIPMFPVSHQKYSVTIKAFGHISTTTVSARYPAEARRIAQERIGLEVDVRLQPS